MKSKFKPGDKVTLIYKNEKLKHYEVTPNIVESVTFTKDKVLYYLEDPRGFR